MPVIGIPLEPTVMFLTKGRDFKWSFQKLDASGTPEDYPAGSLYFEFPDLGISAWTFDIVGPLATLKIESPVVDSIPNRAKWQLVFRPTGEAAGGDPVATGQVVVQG